MARLRDMKDAMAGQQTRITNLEEALAALSLAAAVTDRDNWRELVALINEKVSQLGLDKR